MGLFVPIITMFRNLKDSQKFSFIGIILGIPIIVLTLIFTIMLNQDIKIIEKRYSGIHYNNLMKERAELLNGTFNITSEENEGTMISIKIPKQLHT